MTTPASTLDFDDFEPLAEQLLQQAFEQKAGVPYGVVVSSLVYHFAAEARRFQIPENILRALVMLASAVHEESERELEREDAEFLAAPDREQWT